MKFPASFLAACLLLATTAVHAETDPEWSQAVSVHQSERDLRRSLESAIPTWGVEVSGSSSKVGSRKLMYGPTESTLGSLLVQLDYQPSFFQRAGLGVIGFGPSVGAFPTQGPASVSSKPDLVYAYSLGGHVRYQARFSHQQTFVPTAAWSFERLGYHFRNSIPNGAFAASGPELGLWILLNSISRAGAEEFYNDYGVSHTYLVAEWQRLTGSSEVVALSGNSAYLGLRLEF